MADMNSIVNYQYFIVEEAKSIKLLTFVWYTRQACHKPELIEVNRFGKNTNKWNSSAFIVEKFQKFHGCELVFGVQQSLPEFSYQAINDSIEYEGYGLEVVNILSETLNFKYQLNPLYFEKGRDPEKFHFDNLTSDLILQMRPYFCSDCPKIYFTTQCFVETTEYFTVPIGVPYNAFDKLILPFDLGTWIWTLITFFASYATIFVVYLMKVEVRNIVFGENVEYPSLNVLAHFFELSQNVMPRRNFARFIVMMFILLSFMVRNLYLNDYLQRDMRRPEPIQSEDINQTELVLYVDKRFWNFWNAAKLLAKIVKMYYMNRNY
jgi:hypothetical protein